MSLVYTVAMVKELVSSGFSGAESINGAKDL